MRRRFALSLARVRLLPLLLLPAFLTLALSRCGKKSDADEGGDAATSAGVPKDWDGTTDYATSAFTVSDE